MTKFSPFEIHDGYIKYLFGLSLQYFFQVGTKVLLSRKRVSTFHRLGREGGDGMEQAGGLLPPTRLHETRKQIPKWHPKVLKGNQGSMSQID